MSLRRLISRDSFSSTSTSTTSSTPPPNTSSSYSELSNLGTSAPSSASSYSAQVHSSHANTSYSSLTPFSNSRNNNHNSSSYGSSRTNHAPSTSQHRGGTGLANSNGPNKTNNVSESIPPLTNGADKIYGMENFGYTCYCNSVLQCLYFSKAFRESVVAFPLTLDGYNGDEGSGNNFDMNSYIQQRETAFKDHQAQRKVQTRGVKPHPFTVDPASYPAKDITNLAASASSNPGSATSPSIPNMPTSASSLTSTFADAKSSNSNSSSKISRRLSIFSKSKGTQDDISLNINANSSHNNHDSYGASPSASTLSTVGSTSGPSHTIASSAPSSTSHLLQFPSSLNNHLTNNKSFDASSYALVSGKPAYEGLRGISIGDYLPGANIPVVGFTDDASATVESRKRAALLKGPILNVDHTIKNEENGNNNEIKEGLFTAIKDLFECMVENQSRVGVVSPANLINILKRENELFRAAMHQDAHEFLNFLLNEIIESIDNYKPASQVANIKDSTTWIHSLFEGLLSNETKCLTCESVSRRDEKFLDLSLDISANKSITQCLRQFSASEMLCGRNKFHCDNCGGLQEAEKRMRIKRLPKILALHLKRFKFTEDMQQNTKLFHRVVYPEYLRLMETTYDAVSPEKLYQLYAIVVHIGGGPYHGHYVSVVKTETSGWLLFDDEMVESVDPTYVFNFFGERGALASAYVLFYQEIDPDQLVSDNVYTATSEELSSGSLDPRNQRTQTQSQSQTVDEADSSFSSSSPFISQTSSASTSFASVNVMPTPPPSRSSLAIALKNARASTDYSGNDVDTGTTFTPVSTPTSSSVPASPSMVTIPSCSTTVTTIKTSNTTPPPALTHIQEDEGEFESYGRPKGGMINPFEDSLSPVSSTAVTPMAIPIPSKGNSVVSLVDLNHKNSNDDEISDSTTSPAVSGDSPVNESTSVTSIPSTESPMPQSANNQFNSHSMQNYQIRHNNHPLSQNVQHQQQQSFVDSSLQSINELSSSYSSSSVGSFGGTSINSNTNPGVGSNDNKSRLQSWWKKTKGDISDGSNNTMLDNTNSNGGASIGTGRNASIGSFASSMDSSKEKRRFFGFGKKS
ncbi:cysteine proteinase [Nadsonia fulvescens var. elongata DSM 6958]|uniref:ubiquitinyl hydrolase 1 n=1 Tax=Nadsonia fulvescens var. elongata DSM 6958 TaxID=857566 RepID=A0A1E3PL69_9ASCO|nr:cysteine proteinase [Nadsonia fulvescens var. elongata DSM 6958]